MPGPLTVVGPITLLKLHKSVVLIIWALRYHLSSIFAHNAFTNSKFCCSFYRNDCAVLLTQLHIGKFSKKITQNDHIICFSAVTFFVLKIEKTFFLAQIGTWCFCKF